MITIANTFFELGTTARHFVTDKPIERRPTKHVFLAKGVGTYGKWRAFLTGNNKLLIYSGGKLRTFNIFSYRNWGMIVGTDQASDWKMVTRIWGRAAYVRGGRQALRNGGWLIKRLYLQGCVRGDGWKNVALASVMIPHIMDDAKNCPIVARAKIRAFLGWDGNLKQAEEIAKEFAWLGGVKVPFVPVSRPDGLSFKPQKPRDIYYIQAMINAQHRPDAASAREWLRSNQHRRYEIKGLTREFRWQVVDAFALRDQMFLAGYDVPKMKNLDVATWSDTVHKLWEERQREIYDRLQAAKRAMPLPGRNLIPELEEYRIKTRGELIDAGQQLHHCVGSYASYDHYVHYRKDDVVCQVSWREVRTWMGEPDDPHLETYVNQCFDACNAVTEASIAFQEEVEKHLRKVDPNASDWQDKTLAWYLECHPENQPEYDPFDTPLPARYAQVLF